MFLLSKTAQLKVENSAQTTFRFSPVRYHAPQVLLVKGKCPPYMHTEKVYTHFI
jgi:hypothetical protein